MEGIAERFAIAPLAGGDDPHSNRVADQPRQIVNTGAMHDLRPVSLHCLDGQAQPSGDFAGGVPDGKHLQHLTLALGETPQ